MPLLPLNFEPIYAKNVAYGRLYNDLSINDTVIVLFENDNLPSCEPPIQVGNYEGFDPDEYLNNPDRTYHLTILDANGREIVEVHSDPENGGTPAYTQDNKKYITVKRRQQDTDTPENRAKIWNQNALIKLNVTADIANRLNDVAFENYNITKQIVEGEISHDGVTIEQLSTDDRPSLNIKDNYLISDNVERQSILIEGNFANGDVVPLNIFNSSIPAAHLYIKNSNIGSQTRTLFGTRYNDSDLVYASIETSSKSSVIDNINYTPSNGEPQQLNKITGRYSIYTLDLEQQNILTEKFRVDDFGGIGIGIGTLRASYDIDAALHIFGSSDSAEYGLSSRLKPVIKLTDEGTSVSSDIFLQNWKGHFSINKNVITNSTDLENSNFRLSPEGEMFLKSGIFINDDSGVTKASIKLLSDHPSTSEPYLVIGKEEDKTYTESHNDPSWMRIDLRGVVSASNCFEGPIGIPKQTGPENDGIQPYPGRFSQLEIVSNRLPNQPKIVIEPSLIRSESPTGQEVTLEGGIFVDGYISGGFKTINLNSSGKVRWFKNGKSYIDYRTNENPDSDWNTSLFSSYIIGGYDEDVDKQFVDVAGNLRIQNLSAKNNLYIDLDIFPEEEGYHLNNYGEEEADIKIGMSENSPLTQTKWGWWDPETDTEVTTISIGNENAGIGFWRNEPSVQAVDDEGEPLWADESQLVPIWETENKLETTIKSNEYGDLYVEGSGIRFGLKGTEEWWDNKNLTHEREAYSRLMWDEDDEIWNMTDPSDGGHSSSKLLTVNNFSFFLGDHRWKFDIRKVVEEEGIIKEWNWKNPFTSDAVSTEGSLTGWEKDTWNVGNAKNPCLRIESPLSIHKQIKITSPVQDREYDNDTFSLMTNWYYLQAPINESENDNKIFHNNHIDISVYNRLPNELEDRRGWYPEGDYRNCDYTNPGGTNENDPDPGNIYLPIGSEPKYRKNYQTLSRYEEIPDPKTLQIDTGIRNSDGSIDYQEVDNYNILRSSTITFNKFSYGDQTKVRFYSGSPTEEYVRRSLPQNIWKQPDWVQERGLEKTAPNRLVAQLNCRNTSDSVNGTNVSFNMMGLFQNHESVAGAPSGDDDRLSKLSFGIEHVENDLFDESLGRRYSIGLGSSIEGVEFKRNNTVVTRHHHASFGTNSNHPLIFSVGGNDNKKYVGDELTKAFKKSLPVDSPIDLTESYYFTNLIGMYIRKEKYEMMDVKLNANDFDRWRDDRYFASVYVPSLSSVRYGYIDDFDPDDPNCPKDENGNPKTSTMYKLFTPKEPGFQNTWQDLLPVYAESKTGRLVLNPEDIKFIEDKTDLVKNLETLETKMEELQTVVSDILIKVEECENPIMGGRRTNPDNVAGMLTDFSGEDLLHFVKKDRSDRKIYGFDITNNKTYEIVECNKELGKIVFDYTLGSEIGAGGALEDLTMCRLFSLTDFAWSSIHYSTGIVTEIFNYENISLDDVPICVSINPIDNNCFGFKNGRLYQMNINTGVPTFIKTFPSYNILECCFTNEGKFYALHSDLSFDLFGDTQTDGNAYKLLEIDLSNTIDYSPEQQRPITCLDNSGRITKYDYSTNTMESLGDVVAPLNAIAISDKKEVYAIDETGLYSISTNSYVATRLGNIIYEGNEGDVVENEELINMTYAENRNLYVLGKKALFTLNVETRELTKLFDFSDTLQAKGGMTFIDSKNMYMVGNNNELWKINIEIQTQTKIGDLDHDIRALSFWKSNNILNGFLYNSKKACTIDVNTADVTVLSYSYDTEQMDSVIGCFRINDSVPDGGLNEQNITILKEIDLNTEIYSSINGLCSLSDGNVYTTTEINRRLSKLLQINLSNGNFVEVSTINKGDIDNIETPAISVGENFNWGYVTVEVEPVEAIVLGAQFRTLFINYLGEQLESNWTTPNFRRRYIAGNVTISFKPISDEWETPEDIEINVEPGESINIKGVYNKKETMLSADELYQTQARIVVNIAPSHLSGSVGIKSPIQIVNGYGWLEPGTYDIEFNDIPNYETPETKTITVYAGQTRVLNILYVPTEADFENPEEETELQFSTTGMYMYPHEPCWRIKEEDAKQSPTGWQYINNRVMCEPGTWNIEFRDIQSGGRYDWEAPEDQTVVIEEEKINYVVASSGYSQVQNIRYITLDSEVLEWNDGNWDTLYYPGMINTYSYRYGRWYYPAYGGNPDIVV